MAADPCPMCHKRPRQSELKLCEICEKVLRSVNEKGELEVTYAKVEEEENG